MPGLPVTSSSGPCQRSTCRRRTRTVGQQMAQRDRRARRPQFRRAGGVEAFQHLKVGEWRQDRCDRRVERSLSCSTSCIAAAAVTALVMEAIHTTLSGRISAPLATSRTPAAAETTHRPEIPPPPQRRDAAGHGAFRNKAAIRFRFDLPSYPPGCSTLYGRTVPPACVLRPGRTEAAAFRKREKPGGGPVVFGGDARGKFDRPENI